MLANLYLNGHVLVNNKKITIPSYQVKLNDVISFASEKVTKIPYVEKSINNKDIFIPHWLQRKANMGKLIALPESSEIEKQVNLRLVIEYYSR